MRRSSLLSIIIPLTALVGCAERPTGPPAASVSGAAVSSASSRDGALATTEWQLTTRGFVRGRSLSPIAAARAYALVSLAQYAAVDAADDRGGAADNDKTYGRRGAVAAASARVLSSSKALAAAVRALV